MTKIRTAAIALLMGIGATTFGSAAQAADAPKARFSDVTSYTGSPNLPLTLSLIAAGGGPSKFNTVTLVKTLTGPAFEGEVKSLTEKYGADNVKSFLSTFDFVINDALKIVTDAKVALPSKPAVDPTDGKALSAALYTAGVAKDGNFDVEFLLDNLVSHDIHVKVMNDIDAKISRDADKNYHVMLTQAFKDLKGAYKL
ncbi:MAG: hypothetical protein NVSMB64_21430 [Candidatus Velthaea sp.]